MRGDGARKELLDTRMSDAENDFPGLFDGRLSETMFWERSGGSYGLRPSIIPQVCAFFSTLMQKLLNIRYYALYNYTRVKLSRMAACWSNPEEKSNVVRSISFKTSCLLNI